MLAGIFDFLMLPGIDGGSDDAAPTEPTVMPDPNSALPAPPPGYVRRCYQQQSYPPRTTCRFERIAPAQTYIPQVPPSGYRRVCYQGAYGQPPVCRLVPINPNYAPTSSPYPVYPTYPNPYNTPLNSDGVPVTQRFAPQVGRAVGYCPPQTRPPFDCSVKFVEQPDGSWLDIGPGSRCLMLNRNPTCSRSGPYNPYNPYVQNPYQNPYAPYVPPASGVEDVNYRPGPAL